MENPPILPFGAQYYRAPTPFPQEWAKDLAQFRTHGFNTIKIWAQWRWNNPREGVYDFTDLKELMDVAAEQGLAVIINLIFDVAPAWFWKKYPEARMINNRGEIIEPRVSTCRQIGGFPSPCFHHTEGIAIRREFCAKLAQQMAGHPALYAWDVWNEPELTTCLFREPDLWTLCDYSPSALAAFNLWLQKRYESLDALNRAWNRNYQSWDEVEVPRFLGTFTDMIDWRRFFVDTIVDETRMRVAAIKSADPDNPVMVHTVPLPYFNVVTCSSDEYLLARECDWFGNSVGSEPFPAAVTVAAACGKKVINAEIHALGGDTYHRPRIPEWNQLKRHILVPLARGVKGFLFWQYRPETLGTESPAWGLTDLQGNPTPWLEQTRTIHQTLKNYEKLVSDAKPVVADVAVINGTDNQIFDWTASGQIDRHYQSVFGTFQALYDHQFNLDVISEDFLLNEDLSRYRVVVYPFPYYMRKDVAERLEQFVQQGGMLICEAFPAAVRAEDGLHSQIIPGHGLDRLFQAREALVTSSDMLVHAYGNNADQIQRSSQQVPLILSHTVGCLSEGSSVIGCFFAEGLETLGAEVIARFPDGWVAATQASYGKGQAILIGSMVGYGYAHQRLSPAGEWLAGLLRAGGATRSVRVSRPGVRADLLLTPQQQGLLVVANNRSESQSVWLRLAHPVSAPKQQMRDIFTQQVYPLEKVGEDWLAEVNLTAEEITALVVE